LKVRDNVWLESKNIHSNRLSKKLEQKRMIYNIFNEDLLTKYREPYFKEQYMESASPLMIINKEEEYKVKKVRKY